MPLEVPSVLRSALFHISLRKSVKSFLKSLQLVISPSPVFPPIDTCEAKKSDGSQEVCISKLKLPPSVISKPSEALISSI